MRTLVAGLGNIFEGDDGFGVEVANTLIATQWPDGVELGEYGIRGVHLAYQLLEGYDLVVIADAVSRGGEPGTVYVIEHAADTERPEPTAHEPMVDAHDLGPDAVLALVPTLGGTLGRVVIVGCEPATLEPNMGLSPRVAGSVEAAARLVTEIVFSAYAGEDAPAYSARSGGRQS